ncbi:hypothetical protein APHAL10511_005233 [Amanita phalloides]|nr:hypothetical protein APHAL10511_005233 [Amanita phalloides]
MGRTLFSKSYSIVPPTPPDLDVHSYDTWSKSNPFDPDSDDFFIDAVYEAFVDPAEYERQRLDRLREDDDENRTSIVMQIDTDSGVSLSSGSPVLSSRASPMAVGSDDPAAILADAGYASPSEWDRSTEYENWMRMGTAGYIPPLSIEEEDGAPIRPDSTRQPLTRYNRVRSTSVSASQDQLAPVPTRRTITITPIDLTPLERRPFLARSPSPAPLQTPPRLRDTTQLPDLITPSPAPTVTPHIYRWNTSSAPWMTQSPTPRSTASLSQTSPLTNPSARVSHSRITLAPVHVRMQSAAI